MNSYEVKRLKKLLEAANELSQACIDSDDEKVQDMAMILAYEILIAEMMLG